LCGEHRPPRRRLVFHIARFVPQGGVAAGTVEVTTVSVAAAPTRIPSEASDELAGTPYRTIGLVGRGGMGEVLDAEHRALGRRVVVKLVRADTPVPGGNDRLRLEAQALARLDHPNLVRVLDFGETSAGRPYLVLERLWGRTLLAELEVRGALPCAEAVAYLCQALSGLAEVHAAGLVHRDVKPENLLLCDAPRPGEPRSVKVLDLGIVKVVHDAGGRAPAPLLVPTEQGLVPGTPKFFSPEQAMGLAVDARTDVYAMGVVLYTLLVGHGPFPQARDAVAVAMAHVREPPRPPSAYAKQAIAPGLDEAVLRALAKRPDERFPTAAAFAAALAIAELPRTDRGTACLQALPTIALPQSEIATSAARVDRGNAPRGEARRALSTPFMLLGVVLCSAVTAIAILWWYQ